MTAANRLISTAIVAIGVAACSTPAQTFKVWIDAQQDAVIRRTDPGAVNPINPRSTLPDIITLVVSGWSPFDPVTNRFLGSFTTTRDAHIFRIDIVFSGLVNPPGQLEPGNPAFNPYEFGESPVYGFLDLDIDSDKDTGGELTFPAENRYLANVARFGSIPHDSFGQRAAQSADDIDPDFFTPPFFERTGTDFVVTLCGCWDVEIVSEGGNGNRIFDEGETWLVRGRFFERSQGYVGASAGFGGSAQGHWDQLTTIQFSHDLATDTTVITLVEPLDMTGAALLKGEPLQPIDFNFANHSSIVEALNDIIEGAGGALFGPVFELTRKWRGRDPERFLDVDDWEAIALFGTTYAIPSDHPYVWTDIGFDETPGDVNGDNFADDLDISEIREYVYENDGTVVDADGVKNGRFTLINRGINFSLFDLDGNYIVEGEDLWLYGHRADLDKNGRLDIFDFVAFQNEFILRSPVGDFNLDEQYDVFDFLSFQDAFSR